MKGVFERRRIGDERRDRRFVVEREAPQLAVLTKSHLDSLLRTRGLGPFDLIDVRPTDSKRGGGPGEGEDPIRKGDDPLIHRTIPYERDSNRGQIALGLKPPCDPVPVPIERRKGGYENAGHDGSNRHDPYQKVQ